MSYTVEISEPQRKLIMEALTTLGTSPAADRLRAEPSGETWPDTAFESLTTLIGMFGQLDTVEKEHPGTLHGLCL